VPLNDYFNGKFDVRFSLSCFSQTSARASYPWPRCAWKTPAAAARGDL